MIDLFMQALTNGLLIGGIYALISVGFSLIFGTMGVVQVAHAELAMLGMYVTYFVWAYWGLDPYVSMIFSVLVTFVVGVLIYVFLLRKVIDKGREPQMIITVGLSTLMINLALVFWTPTVRSVDVLYGTDSISIGSVTIGVVRAVSFLLALVLTASIRLFIKKTEVGRAIEATGQNLKGAKIMGINIDRIYMLALGIGSATAGAAGTLLILRTTVYPSVGAGLISIVFVVAVFGGLGNYWGAFVAGILIGLAESLTAIYLGSQYKEMMYLILFLIVLFVRPQGLFGREQGR